MSNKENVTLEPHLSDVLRSGARYPNPFFDLGQQYTPRTVKELFQWCTFFFYTNPLVGATITKISKYPITDLVVEDEDPKIKEYWEKVFFKHLRIKERVTEVNLDLNVYGNAFVSVHLPFTRFLICTSCSTRTNIKEVLWTWSDYKFSYTCPNCKSRSLGDPEKPETIRDVPYRSPEDINIIRWNPENITLRYSEATGRTTYYYVVSPALRYQITTGEQDVLEDMPLLFIQAVKQNRVIKFSSKNLYHLRRPTLAEKDMGWGKPLVYHVMKDLYYMAVLRKAQEAIANEHIVPFDFLFPQPNAQMDPFVHSDLGNWKSRVEETIKKHRWDPNYKAVLPVPIGFGRLGGDGKAMMLTPELNYLNQTIVGGMGIPSEFLFGGLNWSGSSITLRSLQNDFIHNQSQIMDLTEWIGEKITTFLKVPAPKSVRFLDFKMADDIQRIQQMITLNSQRKISDDTLLTELGLDYEKETKRIIDELHVQNKIQDILAKSQAKTSGEASIIGMNYQSKIQELQQRAMEKQQPFASEQSALPMEQDAMAPGYHDQNGAPMEEAAPMQTPGGQTNHLDVHKMIRTWATKLSQLEPSERIRMLTQIKQQMPAFGEQVERTMNEQLSGQQPAASQPAPEGTNTNINMDPLPEQRMPTRAGIN